MVVMCLEINSIDSRTYWLLSKKILIGILEEFRGHLFFPKVNEYSYKMKILQEFLLDKSPFRKASESYQLVHTISELQLKLVSLELIHFGVIAHLFRQIGVHSM